MSILFKGNLEEGNYTLIKSTDGWVLKGETSYVGFNFADRKTENSSEIPNNSDEPQTENPCDGCVCDDGKHLMYCMNCKGIAWKTEPPKVEDEPQTEAFEEPNYYDPALWE